MNPTKALSICRQARTFIQEGQTGETIEVLLKNFGRHPRINVISICSANFNSLQKELNNGNIKNDINHPEKNKIHATLLEWIGVTEKEEKKNTKVFISYSWQKNDEGKSFAESLRESISKEGFTVSSSDQKFGIGSNWAEGIRRKLRESHYVILLLSKETSRSEMAMGELDRVFRSEGWKGKTFLLPVTINFPLDSLLSSPLYELLKNIEPIHWKTPQDSERVIKEIIQVLEGEEEIIYTDDQFSFKKPDMEVEEENPLPEAFLEFPWGTVPLDSKFYQLRTGEEAFIEKIFQEYGLLKIKGPRQYGKTSFLARMISKASKRGYKVVPINFQSISEKSLSKLETLIPAFTAIIARKLNLRNELNKSWEKDLDPLFNCRVFLEDVVLKTFSDPVLLAMDEVDRLFPFDDSKDFFTMLRTLNEDAKTLDINGNKSDLVRFRMAFTYSTTPRLLKSYYTSPFNIGEDFVLDPFDQTHIENLIDAQNLNRIFTLDRRQQLDQLLGGHPYLTRRALYSLAKKEYTFDELMRKAADWDSPFIDHLKYQSFVFSEAAAKNKDLWLTFSAILNGDKLLTNNYIEVFEKLSAAGLVRGEPQNPEIACRLYEKFFRERL